MQSITVASQYIRISTSSSIDCSRTPLHTSLRIGKEYECARRLLINGANLHQQDKDGRTPLHSFFNDAISQAIRHNQHDIDLTLQDRRGMTVAHWASWTSQSLPEHVTHQPLKSGQVYSPFAVADVHGRYMLHFAAERGNVQLVRYFLSQPQALMMLAPDYEGRNILHYATASRRFHLVHALVQGSQLDIEERDHRGRTVLHHAALRMNLSAVEQILALRSNLLDVQDNDGQTPLELARLHGSTSVIGFLEARYPCSTPSLAQSNGLSGKANPGVRLPGRENFGVLKQYFCCFIVILLPVFTSLVLATELALQHGRRL
jgi:ankyrin repeat protein